MSLAGIHYPDATGYFDDLGITDFPDQLADRGRPVEGRRLFMAYHYKAAADMIVKCPGTAMPRSLNGSPLSWTDKGSQAFSFGKAKASCEGQAEKNGSLA